MDRDEQVPVVMSIDPHILLSGATPRLLDEWQEQPKLWNYVRHEVDDRKKKGQFILTGSANPDEDIKLHSVAGRFTVVEMQTMSWQEMGYSSGQVSIEQLLRGNTFPFINTELPLELIIERMIKGGWPALLNMSLGDAIVQQSGGAWAAFEVKLGVGMHDDAANNLLKLNSVIDSTKSSKPASLNIITGTGMSYTRPDGINVISVASLGK